MYGYWIWIVLVALLICTHLLKRSCDKMRERKHLNDLEGAKKWKGIATALGCSVIAIVLLPVVALFGVNYVETEPDTIETVKISSLPEFEYESVDALRTEIKGLARVTVKIDGTEYEVDRVLYSKGVTEGTLRVERRSWRLDRELSIPLPGLPDLVKQETKVTLLMPMKEVKP